MNRETVGRPMEILLVEDSLTDAQLTIIALKEGQVKHRLTLVCDGLEAMAFLRKEGQFAKAPQPDLILLDLQLPKMDGRKVLAYIKADQKLKQIPVVILTASESHEDILRSENLFVDSYMVKPVDMDKFLKIVKQLKSFWLADVILPL